jgi:hypothetical protein
MEKRAVFFGLSSIVTLTGLVVACSSTTTTVTGTDTPTDEGGTKEAGSSVKDSGGTLEDTGTGTATGDKACATETTLQACGTCCIGNHKSGYTIFQNSLLACACKGTGADGGAPCATECASTICAATPKNADATCTTCLQASIGSGGACLDQLTADCTADADCVAEQTCVSQQCKGKK